MEFMYLVIIAVMIGVITKKPTNRRGNSTGIINPPKPPGLKRPLPPPAPPKLNKP